MSKLSIVIWVAELLIFCIGWFNYVACLISGLGISFEQPHKRTEITYFCLPKTIEALWNILEKRRIVKSPPHQDVRFLTKLCRLLYLPWLWESSEFSSNLERKSKVTHSRPGWASGEGKDRPARRRWKPSSRKASEIAYLISRYNIGDAWILSHK